MRNILCFFNFHQWSKANYTRVFGGFYVKHCLKCEVIDALPKVYESLPIRAKDHVKDMYLKQHPYKS